MNGRLRRPASQGKLRAAERPVDHGRVKLEPTVLVAKAGGMRLLGFRNARQSMDGRTKDKE